MDDGKRVVGIIQARMGSTRLPGKSLMNLNGKPLLHYVIQRVKKARKLDAIVLATSEKPENDALAHLALELGINVFRGSEDDVLSRFVKAGRIYKADTIVRITADNPLVSPEEIDRIVEHHLRSGADYSFNGVPKMDNDYPDGLGAEVIDFHILEWIEKNTEENRYREHVTLYVMEHESGFHIETIKAPPEIAGPDIKLDIDTMDDFKRVESLIKALPNGQDVLWPGKDIVETYRRIFRGITME